MGLFDIFSENYLEWEDYSYKLSELEYWEFVSTTSKSSLKNIAQKQQIEVMLNEI